MNGEIWQHMFVLTIPILEKVLRPLIVYLFLVVSFRLAGKRELASLNPFDLVVILTISNTVQNAIIGEDNSVTGGLIGAAALLAINFAVLRYLYTHPRVSRVVEGHPETLVEDGKVKEEALRRQLITSHELEIQANKQGFISLAHVARAEIEPGGSIFFAEKEPTPDEARHAELMDRLERIEKELSMLRQAGSQHAAV